MRGDVGRQARLVRVMLVETDDTGDQQMMKAVGLDGETFGDKILVSRLQNFGFTHNPPVGSHGLMLQLNGARSQGIFLGFESAEHRRKNNEPGETELYDVHGNVISLVARKIRIVSPVSITLEAPEITLKAESIGLDGQTSIGGPIGSGLPASREGTIDTLGGKDDSDFATKVKLV